MTSFVPHPLSPVSTGLPHTLPAITSPVFFVAHRYANHAGPSGYDRFADYLGEKVLPSTTLRVLGNTMLRLPAKLVGWYNGSFEYGRHDCIQELATLGHMLKCKSALYHFLYCEKSLRFLSFMDGRRGHRIIGSFHHCAFKYPKYFRSTRHFSKISHAVVVSRIQIEHLESIVGTGRVSFVPYAVDANYFKPLDERVERPLRCTCVGQHLRDFERLAAITRGICQALPKAEFYIIGAPQRYRAQFELPGVVWKQGISDAEYLTILQNTDLLVLPLLDSTSVTTVNEALGCGVPVLTNPGGVSDYLNDECSVQVPVADVSGMVDATIDLLRNDGRRQMMSLAARRQGLELDWPKSAAKMLEVYRRVLSND